jgi:predicted transcriptional regulator
MARTQTMVQLSEELLRSLDEVAGARGVSRSKLIRDLVADGLRRASVDEVGERIAEGYRRFPQAQPDEWGSVERGSDAATEDLLHRLDAEERATGQAPW